VQKPFYRFRESEPSILLCIRWARAVARIRKIRFSTWLQKWSRANKVLIWKWSFWSLPCIVGHGRWRELEKSVHHTSHTSHLAFSIILVSIPVRGFTGNVASNRKGAVNHLLDYRFCNAQPDITLETTKLVHDHLDRVQHRLIHGPKFSLRGKQTYRPS